MSYGWEHLMGKREVSSGVVTIFPYERGLLYKGGQFVRVLEAGRYRVWSFRHERIRVVDVRRVTENVSNQKLLTKDQITVTLNLIADYEIADVVLAEQSVANYRERLHADVQMAAREVVGSLTVDELLEKRAEINTRLSEMLNANATGYGLNVLSAGIKDIVLAPRVRDLLMKEAEAKRIAQATLIGAREEVAAMRALANAARLVSDNPEILRLRELEVARTFAGQGCNTLVMGLDGTGAPVAVTTGAGKTRKGNKTDKLAAESWSDSSEDTEI